MNYLTGVCAGASVIVHNASVVNICRGIVERVLYVRDNGVLRRTPQPKVDVARTLARIGDKIVTSLNPTTVVSPWNYHWLYSGRKQARYLSAYESLRLRPIAKEDAKCSTFVKAEKVLLSPSKVDPAPRVIQPRSYRYNLMVGRYLKNFEKELFRGIAEVAGYNVVLKGENAHGIAENLYSSWTQFDDTVAVGLDASRFDQHISYDMLKYEHSIYNRVFQSAELAKLLEWQLENEGNAYVDTSRITYKVKGCRMSGDINTSMGNCLIMASIVLAYFDKFGINARLANNGDDCVVFLSKKHLHLLDGIDEWFKNLGFKLTQEKPVDVFEQIEFCQMHPVFVSDQWRMVRNPWTATTKDATTLLSWATEREWLNWRESIGVCGLSMTGGVPVWQAFHQKLRGCGGYVRHRFEDEGVGKYGVNAAIESISAKTRASFYYAFGILPDLQVAIEDEIVDFSYSNPMIFAEINQAQLLYNAAVANS